MRVLPPGLTTPLLGEKVEVYLNRNRQCVSVRHNGIVMMHLQRVVLEWAEFIVQPAGSRRVKEQGHRTVHAWLKGTMASFDEVPADHANEVTYDPYTDQAFMLGDRPIALATMAQVQWDKPRVLVW